MSVHMKVIIFNHGRYACKYDGYYVVCQVVGVPVVKLTVSEECHPPSLSLQTMCTQYEVLVVSGWILIVLYRGRKFSMEVVLPPFSAP